MAMTITDDCINCGACAVECPTNAIFESREKYNINGKIHSDISDDHFFIVTEICTNCAGFDEIKCIAICPMDSIKDLVID